MRAVLAALLVASTFGAATPAQAFDFECSDFRPLLQDRQVERPEAPYCATSFGSFTDEYQFDRCRSEMSAYQEKVNQFGKCLAGEQKRAIEEFNEAVRSFNARASSD